MKTDNCSRRSTLSNDGWAETQAEAALQQKTKWVWGQVSAVPIASMRYITHQMTATNWRRIQDDVWQAGAGACDEVGSLVHM